MPIKPKVVSSNIRTKSTISRRKKNGGFMVRVWHRPRSKAWWQIVSVQTCTAAGLPSKPVSWSSIMSLALSTWAIRTPHSLEKYQHMDRHASQTVDLSILQHDAAGGGAPLRRKEAVHWSKELVLNVEHTEYICALFYITLLLHSEFCW